MKLVRSLMVCLFFLEIEWRVTNDIVLRKKCFQVGMFFSLPIAAVWVHQASYSICSCVVLRTYGNCSHSSGIRIDKDY